MTGRARVGILVSGRGSNMEALIAAAADPAFPAEIALVLSNRPDAPALARAEAAGVPAIGEDHAAFASREEFDRALDERLRAADVGLVCLAGYMRVLSGWFIAAWRGRVLNIHPSLLPSFPGLHPHRRALEAGVRVHGCTVHVVTEGVDEGPIIGQAAVPVETGDDEDRLAARVLAAEHRLYPLCLRLVAEGRTRLADGRVEGEGAALL
ncbi:MAG: phosphoribosylglycinamide formyltransferase [Caulobacterales bacterium]|nr:phosphoribosylglycinamide formyltransferase [Caulobacterales bacterium]